MKNEVKREVDAINWMFVFPQNVHIETVLSNVMVFGNGVFGR